MQAMVHVTQKQTSNMQDTVVMTTWLIMVILAMVLTASASGMYPEVGCSSSAYEYWQANCYYFNKSAGIITFPDAQEQCFRTGGNLASVLSEAENNYIKSKMDDVDTFWIGLHRDLASVTSGKNSFYWVDGSTLVYENWNREEPNNQHGGNENCGQYVWKLNQKNWNDVICTAPARWPVRAYVCKAAITFRGPAGPQGVAGSTGPMGGAEQGGLTEHSLRWYIVAAISAAVCLIWSLFIGLVVGTVRMYKYRRPRIQNIAETAENPNDLYLKPLPTPPEDAQSDYEELRVTTDGHLQQ